MCPVRSAARETGVSFSKAPLVAVCVGNQRPKNEHGVERCREHILSDLSHHSVSLFA
jgi:hypothetical protein